MIYAILNLAMLMFLSTRKETIRHEFIALTPIPGFPHNMLDFIELEIFEIINDNATLRYDISCRYGDLVGTFGTFIKYVYIRDQQSNF